MAIDALTTILANLVTTTAAFVPNLLAALIWLLIGYIVGKIVGIVIHKICVGIQVDKYLKNQGFKLSYLFKIAGSWWIYLVFIQIAAETLGVASLTMFVGEIVSFIPHAVGAAIIVVVGYILGGFFEEQIKHSDGRYNSLVGKVVYFFTVYVAIALALPFIGINATLVNSILLIIIASFGLAFALAVGLGMKESVAKEADKYIGEIKKKK